MPLSGAGLVFYVFCAVAQDGRYGGTSNARPYEISDAKKCPIRQDGAFFKQIKR